MRQHHSNYVYGYGKSRIAQEYLINKVWFFRQNTPIDAARATFKITNFPRLIFQRFFRGI